MKNTLTFRKNITLNIKWWIIKEIDMYGRTIESGSFNEELYHKYLNAIQP